MGTRRGLSYEYSVAITGGEGELVQTPLSACWGAECLPEGPNLPRSELPATIGPPDRGVLNPRACSVFSARHVCNMSSAALMACKPSSARRMLTRLALFPSSRADYVMAASRPHQAHLPTIYYDASLYNHARCATLSRRLTGRVVWADTCLHCWRRLIRECGVVGEVAENTCFDVNFVSHTFMTRNICFWKVQFSQGKVRAASEVWQWYIWYQIVFKTVASLCFLCATSCAFSRWRNPLIGICTPIKKKKFLLSQNQRITFALGTPVTSDAKDTHCEIKPCVKVADFLK